MTRLVDANGIQCTVETTKAHTNTLHYLPVGSQHLKNMECSIHTNTFTLPIMVTSINITRMILESNKIEHWGTKSGVYILLGIERNNSFYMHLLS